LRLLTWESCQSLEIQGHLNGCYARWRTSPELFPDVHAHSGAIEAGIPNVRRIVVEGTGHIMYLEKPAEFCRLVFAFIRLNTSAS
jgi:pimeloyl-ACP methyl ester carboxylesterase